MNAYKVFIGNHHKYSWKLFSFKVYRIRKRPYFHAEGYDIYLQLAKRFFMRIWVYRYV